MILQSSGLSFMKLLQETKSNDFVSYIFLTELKKGENFSRSDKTVFVIIE